MRTHFHLTLSLFVTLLGFSLEHSTALANDWRCVPVQPAGWTRCVGTISAYSKKIAIYFPAQERPVNQLYLHLHGWRIRQREDADFVSMMEGFHLPQIAASAGMSQGVIVVPESEGRCETYIRELQRNFRSFYQSLVREMGGILPVDAAHVRITLSGHSGAFVPIRTIVNSRNEASARIQRVVYLDASYSADDAPIIRNWLSHSSSRTFYAAYRVGTGTERGASALENALAGLPAQIEGLRASVGHWGTIGARFKKVLGD